MLVHLSQLTVALFVSTAFASPEPSEGCGKPLQSSLKPGGPSKSFTFESNAGAGSLMRRRVRIYLPSKYQDDNPSPVILAFHGKYRNGTSFETVTELSKDEFNKDAIVVYPDGIDLRWTGDPYAPEISKNNDVKYAGELLDQIESSFCVDKSRVYATGFSNGGGLTHLLACDPELSSRIAAFAIASGAFFRGTAINQNSLFDPINCKPNRSPIPILEFHGDGDDMVRYDGKSKFDGPTYSIGGWLREWAKRNKCDFANREKTALHNGRVSRYDWACGDSNKPVLQHYVLHGVGHTWPSLSLLRDEEIVEDADPMIFDATPLIKKFFEMHELPVRTEESTESASEVDGRNSPVAAEEPLVAETNGTNVANEGQKIEDEVDILHSTEEAEESEVNVDDVEDDKIMEERPRDEL